MPTLCRLYFLQNSIFTKVTFLLDVCRRRTFVCISKFCSMELKREFIFYSTAESESQDFLTYGVLVWHIEWIHLFLDTFHRKRSRIAPDVILYFYFPRNLTQQYGKYVPMFCTLYLVSLYIDSTGLHFPNTKYNITYPTQYKYNTYNNVSKCSSNFQLQLKSQVKTVKSMYLMYVRKCIFKSIRKNEFGEKEIHA